MRTLAWGVTLLSVAVCARLCAAASPARADETDGAEPVRVRFEDGARCSDERRFFEEVRGRTARVREAGADEPARTFRVLIGSAAGGPFGTLAIEEQGRVSAPRRLEARSCEEVVAALAFVAALSVDPDARARPTLRPPPASAPPPAPVIPAAASMPPPLVVEPEPAVDAPPLAPPSTTPPVASSAPPDAAPVTRSLGSVRAVDRAPSRAPAPSPFALFLGAGPTLSGPSTPSPLVGGRAFLEAERAAASRLHPSLRLSFDLPDGTTVAPIGSSRVALSWTRGSLDACPARWRLPLGLPVSFAPCAGLEAGALNATASQVVAARSSTQAWFALLAEARLRALLPGPLFVELDAGLSVPLTREQFAFDPTTTVYSPPLVVARGLLAVGVHFP